MKILVTGATGFIGQHVVSQLIFRGHSVVAIGRDEDIACSFEWYKQVEFICFDISSVHNNLIERLTQCDATIHLAWNGLPNYEELFHFEKNLFADYFFLKSLIKNGMKHLLVTGTCFEYGMKNGCLSENTPTEPSNPYALAKDTLHKFLVNMQQKEFFSLQWARLFYIYGEGQGANSLLSQLDRAIDNGDLSFNMSKGDQLRDYLHVEEVARRLVLLLENPNYNGVTNICSGEPISIKQLVEEHIKKRGVQMQLNLGFYPYSDFESKNFWGKSSTFDKNGKLIL